MVICNKQEVNKYIKGYTFIEKGETKLCHIGIYGKLVEPFRRGQYKYLKIIRRKQEVNKYRILFLRKNFISVNKKQGK